MQDELRHHTGNRIKHYRKARGLTIEELSKRIHKSKGSISKYESGQISIDISTLFDIANALQIEPYQLLDYPVATRALPKSCRSPFGEADILYLYHMKGKTVYTSVVRMRYGGDEGESAATLFYTVEDINNIEKCECIYEGSMHCHDTILCYTLQNYLNPVENLMLNFKIPMKRFSSLTGLVCGLGANTLVPTSFLALLSPVPLQISDELRETLTIPQDAIKYLRKQNQFTIYQEID